jgi:4-amino-4-deoxy-L-arabinose transferase-like glycosyltransferase
MSIAAAVHPRAIGADALPEPGPRATGLLVAFAIAKAALQLACITQYGWFRDELYYMASTSHLAWGYVEHPPLSIALLALVRATLGDSLLAVRLLPMLAGVATVVLTGSIARQLGGGRWAQGLACLGALLSPEFLGNNHYFSMNSFDLLLWTVAIRILVAILRRSGAREWIALGLVLGVGLLNKISMSWLGMGVAVGLVLTPQRRWLATPWPWVAAVIAGALFLPHVLWQRANGWPTLEFMHNATSRKMVAVGVGDFIKGQILDMGPGNAPLWLAGLGFALFARAARPWRMLAWIYLTVAALLLVGGRSRASYLSVAYPMLLALGGVAWERWLAARPVLRPALAALMVALGLVAIPFALPLLPVDTFIAYQRALHMTPKTEERQRMGVLPQQYADMFGWEDMAALVAKAYARLTPEERAHARVFGQNYGEAGAIDVLGRRYGLPAAMSGHNSYWTWGPGDWDGSALIIIGGDREGNAEFFEQIEIVGQTRSDYSMPYERGLDVSIGRRMRMPPREAWPKLKHFI